MILRNGQFAARLDKEYYGVHGSLQRLSGLLEAPGKGVYTALIIYPCPER
jgi:hypothetical protein